jgi:hypothetical protein
VFVAWRRKALSEKGSYRYSERVNVGDVCACDPTGPGRETLTPVVMRSARVGGRPRTEVVCRPAVAIRRCCLEKADDPLARVAFWQAFEHVREKTLREADADASPLLVAAYVDSGGWLRKELAKVVPEPTDDEKHLAELYSWPGYRLNSPAEYARYRLEHLAEARERLEAYRRGRRQGESPWEWRQRSTREAHDERERRAREEKAARDRAWLAWVKSPAGTPPPWPDVPATVAEARRVWLEVEAQARAYRWGGNPWQGRAGAGAGGAPPHQGSDPSRAGVRPTAAELAAAAVTLGLRWPCSAESARAAYRRLAVACHPDRAGAEATARMAQINVAYGVVQRGLGAA